MVVMLMDLILMMVRMAPIRASMNKPLRKGNCDKDKRRAR